MDALTRIPKVLQTVEEMRQNHPLEQVFANYKGNVQLFIQTMKDEVIELITNYEATIASLQQQIASLKAEYSKNFVRSPPVSSLSSPRKSNGLDLMQTAHSNMFTPFKSPTFNELPISSIMQKKRSMEESRFPEELVSPQQSICDHSQSKFQANSKKRKQREEELRLFLEAGKKNMNVTTNQFLEVIGRTPQPASKEKEEEQKEEEGSKNYTRREESLNKSLGQICESLETSFVSRRARSEKKKKQVKLDEELRRKQQVEQQTAKMLKDRGIKNLLQRLRDNVEHSHQGPRQVITSSKLISCREGPKPTEQGSSPDRNRSKVMINPVPVDIGKRSLAGGRPRDRSPSPERKPQSILKRSSTILSRQISTFSFNDLTI